MLERDPLADRARRAADAAAAPARTGGVTILTRQPLTFRIRDVPGAPLTPAQRAAATAAVAALNPTPRISRPLPDIAADITTWLGADPVRLRRAVALALAMQCQHDPAFARRHGIPVDGDQ